MGNTIYASFADASLAEKAVGALLDFGVRAEDISVVRSHSEGQGASTNYDTTSPVPENEQTWTGENRNVEANRMGYTGNVYDTANTGIGSAAAATELNAENSSYGSTGSQTVINDPNYSTSGQSSTNTGNNTGDVEKAAKGGISTTTAADAGAGAAKGVAWGAGIGILAAVASLVVPGVGLVLGGGALATALGGAAATAGAGAAAGAVTGYLKDQGMDQHIAADYEKAINNGGAMVSVTVPSGNVEETTIRQTLEKYGATGANQYSRGYVA